MGYFLWSKTVGGDDIGGISGSWRSIFQEKYIEKK